MATNREFARGDQLAVVPTAHLGTEATVQSGDPVMVGELAGVALTDEDADGVVTVQFHGVFRLSVVGTSDDGTTGAALSVGDVIYLDDADSQLNADTGASRFGYVLEDVASGATDTVLVKIGY